MYVTCILNTQSCISESAFTLPPFLRLDPAISISISRSIESFLGGVTKTVRPACLLGGTEKYPIDIIHHSRASGTTHGLRAVGCLGTLEGVAREVAIADGQIAKAVWHTGEPVGACVEDEHLLQVANAVRDLVGCNDNPG